MPSPFDRLRTEIDLSVRDITDNAFRLNTKDPDAPAKWMNTLNQAGMEKDAVTGSPPGTSFTQYFNETVAKSRSFMPPEVAEARLGDSGWAASQTQAPFVDPDMDPNAFRNVMFGLNPIGGSAINLLTPREGGGNRVFTPQVPEGFFGSEENLGRLFPVTEAAREITSPFDVLTSAALAGLGPAASAALQGTNRAGRVAARFIDPITRGGLERRLAAETGVNLGGTFGALEAPKLLPEDAPTWQKIGVGLAGALAGGGGSIAAINAPRIGGAALRKGEQAAEAIGRTGVGNVLDPVPPQTVAGRVEDVGAAKPKLIAFNKEFTKRLETEPLQQFDDQFPAAREARVSKQLGRETSPTVASAQTGQPFDEVLFRGFGRETPEEAFVPEGFQGNVVGDGTYATPDAHFSAGFGDEIEELRVSLRNPLVIKTDAEFAQITREAGLRSFAPSDAQEAASLRRVIEARGHDGLIVVVPDTELTGKRLIEVFGSDTVVDFAGVRPDVTAAARQADAGAGLRFDPATNTYNGAPLTRGDILVDDSGRQLQVERPSGFTIEAQILDEAGVAKPGEFTSFDIDDYVGNERFLNVRRVGRNAFEDPPVTPARQADAAAPTTGQMTLGGRVVPSATEADIADRRAVNAQFNLTATGEDAPLQAAARQEAGELPPTINPKTGQAYTNAEYNALLEEQGFAPEPAAARTLDEVDREISTVTNRLDELDPLIQERQAAVRIIRPSGFIGVTDEEFLNLAASKRVVNPQGEQVARTVDPYGDRDWFTSLDLEPSELKYLREGGYKGSRQGQPQNITALRKERTRLRQDLKALQDERAGIPEGALAPDEPTRRVEIGLSPYTEGEQRPTLAFTKTDREMTEDAIDLLNSGNPEKAKQGGELLKAVVEPARVLVRNIFDQAGFENVEVNANFGLYGGYEPSFSFAADVPEDRIDEFTRLVVDTASTDLAQDSVILSSVVEGVSIENVRLGVAPEVGLPGATEVTGKVKSGAPIELLEPSATLRFKDELSAAEYQRIAELGEENGIAGFASHADDMGLNVVNVSAYNDVSTAAGTDEWLTNIRKFGEAIDGDNDIRAIIETGEGNRRWEYRVRRVRNFGVEDSYADPLKRPLYDEYRGYDDSNQAQRRYEGDPQSLNDKNKDKRARQRIIDVIGVKSWNRLRRGNATHASDPNKARMVDGLIDEAVDKDLSDLGASLAGGGKPPGRVVGQAPSTGDAPPPRGSDNALELDLDIPVHEKPSRAVMRRFEGARNEQSLEAEEFADTGNKLLKSLGLDPQRMDAATMRPVFEALHGERSLDSLSPELREVADHVIALRDLETEDMLKFLDNAQGEGYETYLAWDVKTLSGRIMATPDYLPRLWKEAEEQTVRKVGEGGVFGGTPRHAKARADASFSEMIDEHGFEPLSWNPMTMMAIRRMEGVMYREQVKLANQLNRLGKVLPLDDAPDGFRVPEIKSPVFNGRPIPVVADQSPERLLEIEEWAQAGGKDQFPGDIRMTKVLAVPNEVADQLELLYGRRMKAWLRLPFGREIDVFKLIDDFTNAAKRVAVFGTFYQHFDITRRAIFSRAASNIGLPKKSALKNIPTTPGFVWKLLKLQWVPSERAALRKRFLRNVKIAPEYPNSPTWREAVQEGTNIQGDTSYIKRETLQALDETARGSKIPLAGKALENYRLIRDFMESGLFDGIYRGGMEDSMERYVVPELCRQHPDWTSRQIAAEASNVTNEIFSALGNYQTVLSNPNLRRFASWLIFSTNESETLIRQALRVMNPRDPNGRIWRKWYLGIFFALALEANIKHYAATGEPLPPESYIPVNLNDPYAHMFGMHTGVSYNGKFLSPQVPLVRGRNGQPVYEDLMGQMDTSLRWATDPTGALASRLNRAPGAIWRQARGTSFRGQPLDSPIRKAVQLAQDIGLPFSSGGALELLVEKFPALRESIPIGETRLGATAGAIQTFGGINLRTLSTPELEDLIKSGDLTPEQKKSYRIEIETRKEERQRKGFFIPYDPQQGQPPPMSPAQRERREKQLAR